MEVKVTPPFPPASAVVSQTVSFTNGPVTETLLLQEEKEEPAK